MTVIDAPPEIPAFTAESVALYSTCPSSTGVDPEVFRRRVLDVAGWSEAHGCRGQLIYTDNRLVDPWATAQLVIGATDRFEPMIAVQPVYLHPFSAARMISTIGYLYDRRVSLNLVSGGFQGHLLALGDDVAHDGRYDRVLEYASVVRQLLDGARPVTHQGAHYRLRGATVAPPLPERLRPPLYLSGSSDAAIATATALDAVRLAYPEPIGHYAGDLSAPLLNCGIRVGIIARDDRREAWRIAAERFPSDRDGERLHDIAARVVESTWHRRLSARAADSTEPIGPYWLYPFRAGSTFCPYLVGSHADVQEVLAGYFALGVRTLILDVPASEEDLYHSAVAVRGATTALARRH